MIKENICSGKYTVIIDDNNKFHALRFGEEWRDLTGDGLIMAMLYEIIELKEDIKAYEQK